MPARVIILTGPPGAGKTTLAARLVHSTPAEAVAHLHSDDFYDYIKKGFIAPWLKASQRQNEAVTDALSSEDATFRANVRPMLTRDSFEVRRDAPIVNAVLGAATRVLGAPPEVVGQPYWMDAALLSAVGIDTVVIGPTGAGAHALEEWVDLKSIEQLTEILTRAATEFCA